MKREFRLTKPADFQRVRRLGKPHAHPLVVLIALPNGLQKSRIGIGAGRSVGNAVRRNRSKRVLRAAMRPLLDTLASGNDILLLARGAIRDSNSTELEATLETLIRRAGLQN